MLERDIPNPCFRVEVFTLPKAIRLVKIFRRGTPDKPKTEQVWGYELRRKGHRDLAIMAEVFDALRLLATKKEVQK